MKRRAFVKKTALLAGGMPMLGSTFYNASDINDDRLKVHIFSKHLQFLDYQAAGEVAANLGFDGVDLTVRPKGHVLPENVKQDLPKAINEIKNGGSNCSLITTSIKSAKNTVDVNIINTAAESGIDYYRTNWYKYDIKSPLAEQLRGYQTEIKYLGELNAKAGIVGCYQNHAGKDVGSSFWEMYEVLKTVNQNFFGAQYDIRHAMVEGGYSWVNGLKLLKDQIKVIVLKDFKWGKVNGKWEAVNVPIGEGMVDFDGYFKLLKQYGLKPPVSLHLEYPLGGAEKGKFEISIDKQVVFDAMKRDLNAVQTIWSQA